MPGGGALKRALEKLTVELPFGTQGYYREPRGHRQVEVLKNPSQKEVSRWAGRDVTDLRMMFDVDGNVYVWNGYESIHIPIIEGLGINQRNIVDSMSDTPVHPKNYSYWVKEHADDVETYTHMEEFKPPGVEIDKEPKFYDIPDAIQQETDFAGGGKIRRLLPKDIEKFTKLGDDQRGRPEQAMLKASHYMGGGVLPVVIEHVGDLTHRMSHHAKYDTAYPDLVQEKVRRALDYMDYPYGFEKEMGENFEVNARYDNIPLEEFRAQVDEYLSDYADAHKELTVYNRPQYHAREAAVSLGEKNWDKTREHLYALQKLLDQGPEEFDQKALTLTKPEGLAGGGKIGKVTRRDILKGAGAATVAAGAGAMGVGKVGAKKGLGEAGAKAVAKALQPTRNLAGPFAKKVLTPGENTAIMRALREWRDYMEEFIGDEIASMGRKYDDDVQIREDQQTISTIEEILELPDDQVMTPEQHRILSDSLDEFQYEMADDHPGIWEAFDQVHKEVFTDPDVADRWRQAAYKEVPDATDNAKAVFEDILEDGRIWDDRVEYSSDDFEFAIPEDAPEGVVQKLEPWEQQQVYDMIHAEDAVAFEEAEAMRQLGMEDAKLKKAGGGAIRKASKLKAGPGLHEAALEAAAEGDVDTALELLKQLQELLELDDVAFSKMLGQEFGPSGTKPSAIDPLTEIFDPDAPVGGYKHDFPREEMAEGGRPPKGPKGALIRAAEVFARRQGKIKNPDIEIPEGFDHFYTRNREGHTEIIGVRADGSERNVGNFANVGGGDSEEFAKELASIYNTGGFSNQPVVPVNLDEIFGEPPAPPKAEIVPISSSPGNRLRSFQEHLQNLERQGDLDEYELADIAMTAEQSLDPPDYERLMESLYDAGLSPAFYRRFAEEHGGLKPPDIEATVQMAPPQALKDILTEMGLSPEDMKSGDDIFRRLAELADRQDMERTPAGSIADEARQAVSPREVDLRRLSYDELLELEKRGAIESSLAEHLMEEMNGLEADFQDIITDLTGEYPDEVTVVPDLDNPEVYTIKAKFFEGDQEMMFAFDPELGPHEVNLNPDDFQTVRSEAVPYGRTQKVGTLGEMLDEGTLVSRGDISEGKYLSIKEHIDNYAEIDGEYEIYPDPHRPGQYAVRERSLHSNLTEHGGGYEGMIIDLTAEKPWDAIEEVEFTDWPPKPRKGYAEGGEVEDDDRPARSRLEKLKAMTLGDWVRSTGQSVVGAIPFVGEDLMEADVGHKMYGYPTAGFMSQWWGVDPDSDEFVYAGPLSGDATPGTDAIPGIVDEAALLPSLPQMVEMVVDMDELQSDPNYEPSIPAPDFSLTGADRAAENWDRSLEAMQLEEPEGFIENTLMAGGMMVGQLPVPLAMLGRGKQAIRALMPKGMRVAHVLDDLYKQANPQGRLRGVLQGIGGAAPEFIFPTIQPSAGTYLTGALAGGALMTALSPDEAAHLPQDWQSLIEIMNDPTDPDAPLARKALEELMEAYREQEDKKVDTAELGQRLEELKAMDRMDVGYAGGGKISRRDLLKGLGAATVAGGAVAAGAGKAGGKKGIGEVAATQIDEALAGTKAIVPPKVPRGDVFRKVIPALRESIDDLYKTQDVVESWEVEEIQDTIERVERMADLVDKDFDAEAGNIYRRMDTFELEEIMDDLSPEDSIEVRKLMGPYQDYSIYDFDELPKIEQEEIKIELNRRFQEGGEEGMYDYISDLEDKGLDSDYAWEELVPEYKEEMKIEQARSKEVYKQARAQMPKIENADGRTLRGWKARRDRLLKVLNDGRRNQQSDSYYKTYQDWEELLEEIDELGYDVDPWEEMFTRNAGFAGGGKVRKKITRRDVLTGMGAGAAAAGAAALGVGKAGAKKGLDDLAAAQVEQALAPAVKKAVVYKPGIAGLREVLANLEAHYNDIAAEYRRFSVREGDADLAADALEEMEMFSEDIADYQGVIKALEEGDPEKAAKIYDEFDTIEREYHFDFLEGQELDDVRRTLADAGSEWENTPISFHPEGAQIRTTFNVLDETSSAESFHNAKKLLDDLEDQGYYEQDFYEQYHKAVSRLPDEQQRRIRKGLQYTPDYDRWSN